MCSSKVPERIQQQSEREPCHICQQVKERPGSCTYEMLCALRKHSQGEAKYHSEGEASPEWPQKLGTVGTDDASDSEETKMSDLIPVPEPSGDVRRDIADRGQQYAQEDQRPYDKYGGLFFHLFAGSVQIK